MRKHKYFLIFLLTLILCLVFINTNPAKASELEQKLYEAAKKEGMVEYWDSFNPKEVEVLKKGFESKYPGVKVKVYGVRTDVAEEKYLAEHKAGRHTADVLVADMYFKFKKEGLLLDIKDIVKDTGYPMEFCSKDYDGVSMEHVLLGGVGYNTKLVSPQDVPRSYEDLLDPKWKGKINVESRMKDFIFAKDYWKEEKVVDFLTKLKAQNPTFSKGVTKTIFLLNAGEFAISLGLYFHSVQIEKAKGAYVDWAPFRPITDKLTPWLAMKYAPHPNAAKLLLHWWMSKEGGIYMDKLRQKGNPLPESGTSQAKRLLDVYGGSAPKIYTVPFWAPLDITKLEKKYHGAIGFKKTKKKK